MTKGSLILEKTYIWSRITRAFHWILVICIVITFASAYIQSAFLWHISFGIVAGGLLSFRLLWGFIGPFYALFKNFDFSLKDLFYYLSKLFKDKKRYIGHNPAASWATILLIVFGFFCTLSGVVLLGAREDRGIFSFLAPSLIEPALLVHIISKNIVATVALIHVIGALLEHFVHKTDTLVSMIHGFKRLRAPAIKTTRLQNIFGTVAIIFSVWLGVFSYIFPQHSIMTKNTHEIIYKEDNPRFAKQCSECHNLYSPTFMTKEMWNTALRNPKEHFKEDLRKKVPDFDSIKEYILANTAQTAQSEIAQGVIETTKDSYKYRITKTRYWRDIHQAIPYKAYKREAIQTQSNCIACHENFGKTNYINDEDIQLKHFSTLEALKIYLKI